MTYIDSIILGIIEGFTEFLPISSTGHLILGSVLLGLPQTDVLKSFEIAIQLGAICAVALLFWKRFLDWSILTRLLSAFIPTAVIGLLLHSFVKEHLLGNPYVVVAALFLGGVFLIVFEFFHKEDKTKEEDITDISHKQAFIVGVCQAFAIVPGVSRSAATIVGGLSLGLRRASIVEFSFLLAVPTMLAATTLDVAKSYQLFSVNDIGLILTGFTTAFLVALVSVKFLLHYVKRYTFMPFGVYRIIVALLFFFLVL
ncbi:MAG: undecaprenyl-diphosphatase UppP [Candidatus Pacebacteria bacterium]|nr:undecaprenyl-diphosphatase UppP [Candidatus Paceibacterota bacterium]